MWEWAIGFASASWVESTMEPEFHIEYYTLIQFFHHSFIPPNCATYKPSPSIVSEWTFISLGWKHTHSLHKELIKQEPLDSCNSSSSTQGAYRISKADIYSHLTTMNAVFRCPSASGLLATTTFWSWKLGPGPHWFSLKHTYWGCLLFCLSTALSPSHCKRYFCLTRQLLHTSYPEMCQTSSCMTWLADVRCQEHWLTWHIRSVTSLKVTQCIPSNCETQISSLMEARKSNHPNKNKTNKKRLLVISNKKFHLTSLFNPFIQYLIWKFFGLALITRHSGTF